MPSSLSGSSRRLQSSTNIRLFTATCPGAKSPGYRQGVEMSSWGIIMEFSRHSGPAWKTSTSSCPDRGNCFALWSPEYPPHGRRRKSVREAGSRLMRRGNGGGRVADVSWSQSHGTWHFSSFPVNNFVASRGEIQVHCDRIHPVYLLVKARTPQLAVLETPKPY